MTDQILAPLFRRHALLRAVIDAVLEGRSGRVLTAGSDASRAAVLDYGCYRVPGGDPASSEARELLSDLTGPCEIVMPDDDGWRARIAEIFGARVRDRSMASFVPGPELETRTAVLSKLVPAGYALRRMDANNAAMVGSDVSPHGVEVMGGPARFAEHGFGWGLFADDVLACASTSYAVSARFVEVAIATHPAHRKRGLAACAAAAMIADALGRGLEPHWNAYNLVSKRLATRLGFADAGVCEILALDLVEPDQPA